MRTQPPPGRTTRPLSDRRGGAGLREIIRQEVQEKLRWPVESCSPEQFAKKPGLAIGAQIFAPNQIIEELKPLVPQNRPSVSITYSGADEHVDLIRSLITLSVSS